MRRAIKPHTLTLLAALSAGPATGQVAPVADHHQHLFSPDVAALIASPGSPPQVVTARDVAALLDLAGVRRALVLSVAYIYGRPGRVADDEYAKVRA